MLTYSHWTKVYAFISILFIYKHFRENIYGCAKYKKYFDIQILSFFC